MDTKHIKISDYQYCLPDARIAKFPLAQRDHSKLLVYRKGEISESQCTFIIQNGLRNVIRAIISIS